MHFSQGWELALFFFSFLSNHSFFVSEERWERRGTGVHALGYKKGKSSETGENMVKKTTQFFEQIACLFTVLSVLKLFSHMAL